MLPTRTDDRLSYVGWFRERKLDGEGMLAFRDGGSIRLRTHNDKRAPRLRKQEAAEFGLTEWTRDGRQPHPRFDALRRDNKPSRVVLEAPGG